MPRKAPSNVEEVRVTLGDFERKQLVEAINAYQTDKIAENVPNFLIGGAAIVASGGVALAAYALWRWLDLGDIIEDIETGFNYWSDKTWDTIAPFIPGLSSKDRRLVEVSVIIDRGGTEQDILDYFNPKIAAVEARIRQLEERIALQPGLFQSGYLDQEYLRNQKKLLATLLGERNRALMELATKERAPDFEEEYGRGLLLQSIKNEFEQANPNLPPLTFSSEGNKNAANRVVVRDLFTAFASQWVVNWNAANPDEIPLYYEIPTGYTEQDDGTRFLIIYGALRRVGQYDTYS